AGLTPTPYQSGRSERGQGISKAGNKHVRGVIGEAGWLWLRGQPGGGLGQGDARRVGGGGAGGGGGRGGGRGAAARGGPRGGGGWRCGGGGELRGGAVEKDWRVRVNSKLRQRAKAAAAPAAG